MPASKSLTAKSIVIVHSSTGKVIKKIDGDMTLGNALRQYATEIGADPEEVKRTSFGTRLSVPGKGDFRATYR